jgi:hypothetical protein
MAELIGICGKARSGKSTASGYLVKNRGFTSRNMADPLKEMLSASFHFTDDQLWGDEKETPDDRWRGITPRKALQFVGTDVFRNQMDQIMPGIGTGFWIESFKIWYSIYGIGKRVVVDDIRFQDEIDMILSLGGKIMVIERPDLQLTETHKHESEALDLSTIPTCHWRVTNNMDAGFFYDIDTCIR